MKYICQYCRSEHEMSGNCRNCGAPTKIDPSNTLTSKQCSDYVKYIATKLEQYSDYNKYIATKLWN